MKAVLISVRPKWCGLIASGKKTIEVRKTKPKLDAPFKVYIYCTHNGTTLKEKFKNIYTDFSGKVIGEFVCDNIAKGTSQLGSCLSMQQISEYANGKEVYGWHISDLVIYDKPKELSEFRNADKCPYASKDGCTYEYHCFRAGQTKRCGTTLTRPPQSWCYVEKSGAE